MKYYNKRNGKVAVLISEDSKFKTVMLEHEDGSTVSVSQATLKRWWKPFSSEATNPEDIDDQQYVAEVMEQKKDLGIEVQPIENIDVVSQPADDDKCADGRTYAEIGKEIAEQAKQKAKNARKKAEVKKPEKKSDEKNAGKTDDVKKNAGETSKKQVKSASKQTAVKNNADDVRTALEAELERSLNAGSYVLNKLTSQFHYVVKRDGKSVAEIMIRKNGKLTFYCKEATLDGTAFVGRFETLKNYNLSAVLKNIELEDVRNILNL